MVISANHGFPAIPKFSTSALRVYLNPLKLIFEAVSLLRFLYIWKGRLCGIKAELI